MVAPSTTTTTTTQISPSVTFHLIFVAWFLDEAAAAAVAHFDHPSRKFEAKVFQLEVVVTSNPIESMWFLIRLPIVSLLWLARLHYQLCPSKSQTKCQKNKSSLLVQQQLIAASPSYELRVACRLSRLGTRESQPKWNYFWCQQLANILTRF